MKKILVTAAAVALGAAGATGAAAQGMPMGEELYGQTVQVRSADGTLNTIRSAPTAMPLSAARMSLP